MSLSPQNVDYMYVRGWVETNSFSCFLFSFSFQEGTDMRFYLNSIDAHKMSQPYILVLGSRINPLQIMVIVERKAVEFTTLTKAVDYCFKLIYVLDVQYQAQCIGTWEFLQNLYLTDSKTVAVSTSVRDLLIFLANEQ